MADVRTDPIHQFGIHKLVDINIGGYDVSFTNSSLFMVITLVAIAVLLLWGSSTKAIVPGRMQALVEVTYDFVAGTLRGAAGEAGMRFMPLVFSLFMFVLTANMFGMVPYFFTVTSHIIVTAALALLVILTVTIYGFYKNGTHFFNLFVPSGVPAPIVPLVTLIEIISFLSRPISLSVRLFANMLAGHTMLKVFAMFVVSLGTAGGILSAGAVLPMLGIVAVTALEFLVAGLQAYVFAVLTSIYLNDAIHLHEH